MRHLFILLTISLTFPLELVAQPAADSALVARIYANLARGDVEAVVAVLDDHVLWTEGEDSPQAGRYFGPATVAADVLSRQVAGGMPPDVPDLIRADRGYTVAVGTSRRTDPATGTLVVTHFRHVWQVLDGRVVSVHRADDVPDRQAGDVRSSAPR